MDRAIAELKELQERMADAGKNADSIGSLISTFESVRTEVPEILNDDQLRQVGDAMRQTARALVLMYEETS